MTATRDAVLARLDELIAGCRAATPGPWFVVGPPWNHSEPYVIAGNEDPHVGTMVADLVDLTSPERTARPLADEDAAHIAAHFPDRMLALYEGLRAVAKVASAAWIIDGLAGALGVEGGGAS